jgi:hypothetical protein
MHQAFPARYFTRMGLVSLLLEQRRLQGSVKPPDAEPHVRWYERAAAGNPAPYSITR